MKNKVEKLRDESKTISKQGNNKQQQKIINHEENHEKQENASVSSQGSFWDIYLGSLRRDE